MLGLTEAIHTVIGFGYVIALRQQEAVALSSTLNAMGVSFNLYQTTRNGSVIYGFTRN